MPQGGGYWPALWIFGNLGRAVYQNSNTGLWPWSYDQCDGDLVLPPTDPPQRISACDPHDYESEGLHAFQGRGATELDVLEGAVTNTGAASYVVGSLQLSPGLPPYFKPPMFGFPTTSVRNTAPAPVRRALSHAALSHAASSHPSQRASPPRANSSLRRALASGTPT